MNRRLGAALIGERIAIMALRPNYAEAILDGQKRYEFRKRPLASDVREVVIYETLPAQRIVGHFAVQSVLVDSPEQLWLATGDSAGMDREAFFAYFANSAQAIALRIGHVVRYKRAVALTELDPEPSVPQSFNYLPCEIFRQIQRLQGSGLPVRPYSDSVTPPMPGRAHGDQGHTDALPQPS